MEELTAAASGDNPGIGFEKLTAGIQQLMDPAAVVTHNERLVDRLGHSRQFDVVIRGTFAGQAALGVMECKDYKGKVGNPDVEAFVTKSQDVRANFKILVSRRGFTKPALEKCALHGIQALSLTIDIATLDGSRIPQPFSIEDVVVRGSRAIDWLTNYLAAHDREFGDLRGPVLDMALFFRIPEVVAAGDWTGLCTFLGFRAERSLRQLEYAAGLTGPGFFDWLSNKVTFPPGSTITTRGVPMDFSLWQPRPATPRPDTGLFKMKMVGCQFAKIEGVFDLESIGSLKWGNDGAWRPPPLPPLPPLPSRQSEPFLRALADPKVSELEVE